MNIRFINHPVWGKALFADNGVIEIGIPLEFGIRIGHLSYINEENLFYEQPNDLNELCTPQGWRARGGHRLWVAPESEKEYFPDNSPITYEIFENTICLYQEEDPWLKVIKSIEITFEDKECISLKHKVTNTDNAPRKCSVWAVTSAAPNGIEYIPLNFREGGYDPLHKISMWDYTSLGDERVKYERQSITLCHSQKAERYKIGVGHPAGPVTYTNKGVVFEKSFKISPELSYPDGEVSFETFMCRHMVEIESLSPLCDLEPGGTMEFCEKWRLKKSN